MTKIINTFNQGMDRDSSKNKYDNKHYYDAKNMRLSSQEGLSGGALENLRGTALRVNIRDGATSFIVGHVVLGDYVILWTTTNDSNVPNLVSVDSIYKVPIATLDALTGAGSLTLDDNYFHLDIVNNNLIYTGTLGLCTANIIVAVARYDNDDIQKVYWVDTYNRLRHINTVYNADTNDLVNMTVDKLEVVGNLNLSQPVILDVVSGNLRAGKVQYTYQLYALHGAETIFSPTSGLVHLVSYPDNSATSEGYRGSNIDDNAGKAVKGSIDVSIEGYTRIRIVALHYTTLAGEPEIRIIEEREISGSIETIYFTDTGSSVGSYILEDVRTIGTVLFSPKELEAKDNLLFPANITEESFDVTYDARAYRFSGAEPTTNTEPNYNAVRNAICRIFQEDDTYYEINGSTKVVTGTAPSASGDWASLDEEIDAINKFNDLDNDGDHEYRYMYQADGIVPGGEGPNVSYKFKIKEMSIDDNTATTQKLYTLLEGTVDNPSYTDYASPYNTVKYLGYHRDETYRFGIVFFDTKGRSSFVKWIGDIRMPSISTLSDTTMYNAGGGTPTAQVGTVTLGTIAATTYSITVDGILCTFNNDDGAGGMIQSTAYGLGNIFRNIMVTKLGHLASFSPNVAGVWDVTFDQIYGQYTVVGYNPTYVAWNQLNPYVASTGASSDHSIAWYDSSSTDIIGNALYLEFEVDNLPPEAESYQIVRVKRESLDRSVMAQGVIGPVASGPYRPGLWDMAAAGSDLYSFQSPEVAFNKNLTKQSNDFIQEVGEFFNNCTLNINDYMNTYKYTSVIALTFPQYRRTPDVPVAIIGAEQHVNAKTDIVDGKIVKQDQIEAVIGGNTFNVNNSTDYIDKGISFIFEASNTSFRVKDTAAIGPDTTTSARKLFNYRRNIFSTQYGGLNYNSRRRNFYIAASDIQSNLAGAVNVYGGDTFVGMFDYLYSSWEEAAVASTPDVLYFPCETSINLPLRIDSCYHRVYGSSHSSLMHDTTGIWTDGAGTPNEWTQTGDLYQYNTVYSKENDAKLFIQPPFDWSEEVNFPTRVYASNIKVTNELADSWLIYGANSFKDVDPQYGEITKLITMNNKLIFFQPKAFGILSVNERALLQTSEISQLSLGVSGVLERFEYGKTQMGASDTRHVLLTPNGLYWVDTINKAMYKFTGGPEEVSLMKGLDHYFRTSLINPTTTFLFYDPEFKEVCVNDYTDNWSLIYNELIDSFTGFNDYFPSYVINYNDKLYGTRDGYQFYRHNDVDANRGLLYGTYYPTSITLLINPDNATAVTFNNMEWLTEVYTAAGLEADVTFDTIQFWNDYQGSISTGTTLTEGTNVKRRMRKWRHVIPRVIYEKDGSTPKTRRDARFRDTHLFVKLTYTNDANDRRFISHDIITSVRSSNM